MVNRNTTIDYQDVKTGHSPWLRPKSLGEGQREVQQMSHQNLFCLFLLNPSSGARMMYTKMFGFWHRLCPKNPFEDSWTRKSEIRGTKVAIHVNHQNLISLSTLLPTGGPYCHKIWNIGGMNTEVFYLILWDF